MTSVVLERPELPVDETPSASPRGAGMLATLRAPLLIKLLGANLLLVAAASLAHELLPPASLSAQMWAALGLSYGVSTTLVWLALRPLAVLEDTAARVSAGDFAARVPLSPLADRDMRRLSATMNRLLARVESDRARIQYLAGRAVRARDLEREAVSRELRESLAQMLSASAFHLAAARGVNAEAHVEEQLRVAAGVMTQLSEDIRMMADALYPGTLDELGLHNALDALARRVARRSQVRIDVDAVFEAPLSPQAAAALFRVADEALRNVAQHAGARHARVLLWSNSHVILEIEDDGSGMDLRRGDPVQAGLGLFSARAVLALAGGDLQISSAPGRGTRVVARLPASRTGNRS